MTTRRKFFGLLTGGVLVPMVAHAEGWAGGAALADRAEMVSLEKQARFSDLPDGIVVNAGGSRYRRIAGAVELPDLPNWVPDGDVSVLHFGAVGDCNAEGVGKDDRLALQRALNWWIAADYRKLIFPADRRYRLGGPLRAHLDGKIGRVGNILFMEGPITPDPGIGTALSLKGFRHGHFRVRGYQGGRDADYRQEEPEGGDTLFRINASRRCTVDVEAVDYPGRAVYVGRGSKPYKQSFIDLTISTGDIASLPGARPVGQMIYAQGTTAWGSLNGNGAWEAYGSVFENVVDLRVDVLELGTRNRDAPLSFLGCGSVWIDSLLLGDTTQATELVRFVPNAAGKGCRRIHIGRCFAVSPKTGVVVKDTDPNEYGIRIDHLETRNSSGPALILDGVTGADINLSSQSDAHSAVIRGRSSNIKIDIDSYDSTWESVVVEAPARDIRVTGLSRRAAPRSGEDVAVVRVETTGAVFFDDFHTRGEQSVSSFDLVVDNNVTILGGRYEAGAFRGEILAKQVRNARGLRTETQGVVELVAGESTVTVRHGLLAAPEFVTAIAVGLEHKGVSVGRINSEIMEFVISRPVQEKMEISYRASLRQALAP